MDEMTLTLNSPLTDEQWDMLNDFDFERTNRIWFHTKRGKVVEFAKVKPILTNADRIRAMTDEELAEFLANVQAKTVADIVWAAIGTKPELPTDKHITAWCEWAKQEVDDGD